MILGFLKGDHQNLEDSRLIHKEVGLELLVKPHHSLHLIPVVIIILKLPLMSLNIVSLQQRRLMLVSLRNQEEDTTMQLLITL